jgi:hypothetical protein
MVFFLKREGLRTTCCAAVALLMQIRNCRGLHQHRLEAERGHAEAAVNMGSAFYFGQGIPQSREEVFASNHFTSYKA